MKPLSLLALITLPALAQLPAPNKAGVSAGHDVLRAKDVEAANNFWKELGGEPVQFAGRFNLIKFPGVLLLEVGGGQGQGKSAPKNPAPPAELAGSEGSSLDFIGFSVKDLKGSLAKWADAGMKPLPGGSATRVYLFSPDKIKVRIAEDRSLGTPIAADTIKMVVPNVAEAQAWYAKYMGPDLVKHGNEMVAHIPGSSIISSRRRNLWLPQRDGLSIASALKL